MIRLRNLLKESKKFIDFDKNKFKTLISARIKDPENERYHDAVQKYLNKVFPGAGDSFSEQFDPVRAKVSDAIKFALEVIEDAKSEGGYYGYSEAKSITESKSITFDKSKFKTLITARIKDPENERYHDAVKKYLNTVCKGVGDAFSEQFDPESNTVKDAITLALEILEDESTASLPARELKIKEFKDPNAEEETSIDDMKPGTDMSMDKLHSALMKLQKEKDLLFKRYKAGEIGKADYIEDFKANTIRRNKIEARWKTLFDEE